MTETLFDALPEAMKSIRTRPLFTLQLTVGGMTDLGATANQTRRIGAITGGVFQGERLSGQVAAPSADWQTVRSDDVLTLDVRLALETDDGTAIGMTYRGLRHGPPEVMAQLAQGAAVDPALFYFRITAQFETAAPHYAWLNRIVAIGAGHRQGGRPTYSLFEVL